MSCLVLRWETVLLALLAAELAVFGTLNPRFLSWGSLLYGTSDFVQIGLVALPLTLVVIAGGIDVSFGSTIGLCAIAFGVCQFFGAPPALAIAAALALGAACGAFNAAMIGLSRIQPLVVTLGSLYLFSGAATVLAGAVGARGYEGIGDFAPAFTAFGYADLLGVPAPLATLLVIAAALMVTLHATRFGRTVFMVGQSEGAARYSGLPAWRTQAVTYVLTGLCAAIAGLVLAAYFGSARVDLGSATLLPAVTAAVLGGASIYGGQGSVAGTLIATFVIGYLQQGLQMTGVPSQLSSALSGGLLIAAVGLRYAGVAAANRIAVARMARTPAAPA